jgi:hypothetical protein
MQAVNELPRSRTAGYQNEFYLINPDAEHRGIHLIKKNHNSFDTARQVRRLFFLV